MSKRDPINPTDDDARAIAQRILQHTRYGALAVRHPETRAPYIARVAILWINGNMHTLISTLATHTQALLKDPSCAVLVGEPGDKGDPLTHPRMTVSALAAVTEKNALKDHWLAAIPKAQLYYGFSDFMMFKLAAQSIDLNAGFGKAYRLGRSDLPS